MIDDGDIFRGLGDETGRLAVLNPNRKALMRQPLQVGAILAGAMAEQEQFLPPIAARELKAVLLNHGDDAVDRIHARHAILSCGVQTN